MLSFDTQHILGLIDQLRQASTDLPPKYQVAADYARSRYDKGFKLYQARAKRLHRFRSGRLLDVGCGAGHWSLALAQQNELVVGLDPSVEYVEIARFLSSHLPNGYRTHFLSASAEEIPYPDHYFDSIICHGVLMFTDHDRVIQNFNRLLKPGGHLYIGYSGLGWYLMYLLWYGIISHDHAQGMAGLRVLSDSFKWKHGFPGRGWLSLSSTQLLQLLQAKGFQLVDRPEIQEGICDFLGFEATYDLVLQKVQEADTQKSDTDAVLQNQDAKHLKQHLLLQLEIGNLNLVSQALNQPIPLSPEDLHLLKIKLLVKQNKLDQAQDILAKSPESDVDFQILRGIHAHVAQDYASALKFYHSAEASLTDEKITYLKAECLREQGELDQALRLFRAAISHNSNHLPSWVGTLGCCYQLKDVKLLNNITRDFIESRRSHCPIEEVENLLGKLPDQPFTQLIDHNHEWTKAAKFEVAFRHWQVQDMEERFGQELNLESSPMHSQETTRVQPLSSFLAGPGVQNIIALKLLLERNCRRVIDFGCGNDQFLYLCKQSGMTVTGLELPADGVMTTPKYYGLDVQQHNLDQKNLRLQFEDNSFDYSVTIGVPVSILEMQSFLRELLRIGRRSIIVVPNYAYFSFRWKVFFSGFHPALTEPNVAYNFVTQDWIEYHLQQSGANVLTRKYAFPHDWTELLLAPGGLPQTDIFKDFEQDPQQNFPKSYLRLERFLKLNVKLFAKFFIYEVEKSLSN